MRENNIFLAVEKQKFYFQAKLKNVEICEVKEVDASWEQDGKIIDYHYIRLTCNDVNDTEEIFFLRDNNMENLHKYKCGMIGTFIIRIDVEESYETDYKKCRKTLYEKVKIKVVDFIEEHTVMEI